MRLCWFEGGKLGLVREGQVLDVSRALDVLAPDAYPAISGDPVISHLQQLRLRVEEVARDAPAQSIGETRFLSPVARPTKIIGTPANYLRHIEEAEARPEVFSRRYVGSVLEQGLFLKASSALVGPSQGVRIRFPERRTDHEMELGVVIGKKASRIDETEALDYVAGYAIALDMVVRGPEDRSLRKSIDTYAVLGPWLVTADEIQDPGNLEFSLSVGGKLRQHSNTRFMILSIARQIAWASQFYTLWPGDIIMTGTCEGVAQVRPGDVMHCFFERIGEMEVKVS